MRVARGKQPKCFTCLCNTFREWPYRVKSRRGSSSHRALTRRSRKQGKTEKERACLQEIPTLRVRDLDTDPSTGQDGSAAHECEILLHRHINIGVNATATPRPQAKKRNLDPSPSTTPRPQAPAPSTPQLDPSTSTPRPQAPSTRSKMTSDAWCVTIPNPKP